MSRKSRLSLRSLPLEPPIKSSSQKRRSITVKYLFHHWISSMLPLYKPSTRQFLTTTIGLLEDTFGHLKLHAITTELLQAYIAEVGLSPKTIANRLTVFRTIWKAAIKWGYVKRNPFDGLVLPRLIEPDARSFSLEEVMAILELASEPYRTLFQFAAETGLRGGEICALPWSEVDLERQTIRVVQSVWRGELSPPKTRAGRRTIFISAHLCEALKKLKSPKSGTVFANQNGQPRSPEKVVQLHLRPLLRKLGIPGAGLHAFRHFNASIMDRELVPMKTRQNRLGHTNAQTTLQLYTHLLSESDQRAATRIGNCLVSEPRSQQAIPRFWWSSTTLLKR